MYIVEGNIGAGKSTFLKLIQERLPHVTVALEPIHNWQKKVYGQSLLANFYEDPARWAYTMETLAMICRVQEHLKDQESHGAHKIVERSIYSGHYCFAKNGYDSGFLSELEWQLYNQWFDFLIPGRCRPPLGFIYLKTDPEVSYQRLKKRNRLAEKRISLSYLKQIDQRHHDFLIEKKDLLPELQSVPVLILNCDEEFEADENKLQEHLARVQEFMAITQLEASMEKASRIAQK
jgi:deoxyadenosine/deoxycytidine kinase